MKLQNKVIVITGATRGIGLAIAEACGKQGAKIVICSRNKMAVAQTIDALTKKGVSIFRNNGRCFKWFRPGQSHATFFYR